jgi:hypothetical protein
MHESVVGMVYFYYVDSRRDKIKGHMENPSLVSRFTWIPILYSILTVLNSDICRPVSNFKINGHAANKQFKREEKEVTNSRAGLSKQVHGQKDLRSKCYIPPNSTSNMTMQLGGEMMCNEHMHQQNQTGEKRKHN